MISLAQALLSGVLVGGVYGLLSIGFSLAFGVMRIVNFAHGDVVMYGMYAGVVAAGLGIDPLYIIPVSFLLMAALGAAQYMLVYKRFVGRATLQQLLAAIGLGLVLQMLAPTHARRRRCSVRSSSCSARYSSPPPRSSPAPSRSSPPSLSNCCCSARAGARPCAPWPTTSKPPKSSA
jgi:branched-subunit amino acid ABC-type transport system permease component